LLSNLPADTPVKDLALGKLRWRIEHDYGELEDTLGGDHFEGHSYRGSNRQRHAHLGRARGPDPVTTTMPANQGGSLTLFQLIQEFHSLLAYWHRTCLVCRR
jgi:hypothetical protein